MRELITEYHHVFTPEDLELGKTSLVKHSIKLDNYTLFNDRYRWIPPLQCKEVRKHLKDMVDIRAVRRPNSPWASAVALVRKKDGRLGLFINSRKLNARTVKVAYSLPRIEESLDCLNGAQIFTSLDLKSDY